MRIFIKVYSLPYTDCVPKLGDFINEAYTFIKQFLDLLLFLEVLLNQLIERQLGFVILFDVSPPLGIVLLVDVFHHDCLHWIRTHWR